MNLNLIYSKKQSHYYLMKIENIKQDLNINNYIELEIKEKITKEY